MNEKYKLARKMNAIAKTQLAQTGGVIFRQDNTITTYATLSEAVAQVGSHILRPSFYLKTGVDAALIYVTGSTTENDANFYDIRPFEYVRMRRLKQKLPLTPISTIEEELTTLLDGSINRQTSRPVDYGTQNSTLEKGWFERAQAPVNSCLDSKVPAQAKVKEGIERLFHEPQKFNN